MPSAKPAYPRHALRPVSYILCCLALISLFCLDCRRVAEPPPGGKYNLLLISIDTLRADHLKCYGYKEDTSPHLDRLAKEGILFENLTAASSLTVPSHMSMFTSLYPTVHGVQQEGGHLAEAVPTLAQCLAKSGYTTAAFVMIALNHRFGFNQGFQSYDDVTAFSSGLYTIDPDRGSIVWNHTGRVITNLAAAWLKKHSQENFFLFLHYWDCHSDYDPPPPYDTRFDPDYDGKEDGSHIAGRALRLHELSTQFSARDLAHMEALYDGTIAFTDENVGKVLQALKEMRLSEKTLVIVLSDHGEGFLEHGLLCHGNSLYEEALHVPLIMRLPGVIPAGKRVTGNVSHVDLLPTVLGFLHLPCLPQVQGIDLTPVILTNQPVPERLIYSELTDYGYNLRAVRWGHRKLLGAPGTIAGSQLEEVVGGREKVIADADLKKACPGAALQALAMGPPSIPGAKARKATEPDPELLRQLKSLGYMQ